MSTPPKAWRDALRAAVPPAARAFFGALLAVAAGGLIGAGAASAWALRAGLTPGLAAGALSLLAWAAIASPVAVKRAVAAGLGAAAEVVKPGRGILTELFARILGVHDDALMGQRGGAVTRAAENLPLREAEARLRAAVEAMAQAPLEGAGARAGLRRRIRDAALARVERLTLAQLRAADAPASGVDLGAARDALIERVDAALIEGAADAARRFTLLACGGAATVTLALALLFGGMP
ncbi:MAG: hypothetical protein H6704_05150 [Myxococcales bacterium]|nr:hypothetical protein [Myxococcales bacterium]